VTVSASLLVLRSQRWLHQTTPWTRSALARAGSSPVRPKEKKYSLLAKGLSSLS